MKNQARSVHSDAIIGSPQLIADSALLTSCSETASITFDGIKSSLSAYMCDRRPKCPMTMIGVLFLDKTCRPIAHFIFSAVPMGNVTCAGRIAEKAKRIGSSYVVCALTDPRVFKEEIDDGALDAPDSEPLHHFIYNPTADLYTATWQSFAGRLQENDVCVLFVYVFDTHTEGDEYMLAWDHKKKR